MQPCSFAGKAEHVEREAHERNRHSCTKPRAAAFEGSYKRQSPAGLRMPVYPTTSSRVQDDAVMSPARFVPTHYPSAAQFPSFVNSLPILRAAATLNGIRQKGAP